MTQRTSSHGNDSKDGQSHSDSRLLDAQPETLDTESKDTQHHTAIQRLQKSSSRRQSRDQDHGLSSGGKSMEKNTGRDGKSVHTTVYLKF
jgi:hypothetical protein